MSKKDANGDQDSNARDASPVEDDARAPYEPPAIKWIESFDREATLAAACGKVNVAQGGPCQVAQTS